MAHTNKPSPIQYTPAQYRAQATLAKLLSMLETQRWVAVSERLPEWSEDQAIIGYTQHHDYGGQKLHELRASDFYEQDPDAPADEMGTELARNVTHWALAPTPEAQCDGDSAPLMLLDAIIAALAANIITNDSGMPPGNLDALAMQSAEEIAHAQAPTASSVLNDPAASFWLRGSLEHALARDPVDALNDAETLVAVLRTHADKAYAAAMDTLVARTASPRSGQ